MIARIQGPSKDPHSAPMVQSRALDREQPPEHVRGVRPIDHQGSIMIDHLSLGVADLGRSIAFYDAVLAPLGHVRLWANDRSAGWGPAGSEEPFAILATSAEANRSAAGFHLAFSAPSREAVNAFHAAALRLGGTDEGAPGLRPHYGDGYYAAFVLDLDGHKLEAVRHEAGAAG